MQVDGVEEELPDEVENACSDDSKMIKYTHLDSSCSVCLYPAVSVL